MINSVCPSCGYKFNPFKKLLWNTQLTYDCPSCGNKLAINETSSRIMLIIIGLFVLLASVLAFPGPTMINPALLAFPICLVLVVIVGVFILKIEQSKS